MVNRLIAVILCLWCCGTSASGTSQRIPKCCPRTGYEIVAHLTRDRASSSAFECISLGESSLTDSSLESSSLADQFYGLQTNDSDALSRIPVCPANARQKLFELTELTVVQLPVDGSCVDLVNDTYQAVMCAEELQDSPPAAPPVEVYALRKCCPVNFVYDEEYRTCVELDSQFEDVTVPPFWPNESMDIQLIKSLLNQFQSSHNSIGEPLFHLGPPQCGADEVLISHYFKAGEFELRHNRIIPKSPMDSLLLEAFGSQPRDAFCVETMAPPTTTHPPPRRHLTNMTWVVRVCRHKSVCAFIPCVRKCCNYNEKLVKGDNGTVCEPHPYELNVTLHDLRGEAFPEKRPAAVSNAGL